MQTRQLEYFLAVAEDLSFTQAAKRFFISQAALSQQIKALEREVGVVLLDRDRHHVELTAAGREFQDAARAIVERMGEAVERARRADQASAGELRIGYVKGYERTDLSQMVRDFARANPGVTITFLRENVVDLYDALRAERIDVAINIKYLGSDDLMAGIEWQALRTYPLVAMLPFGHPLAGHRTVTLEELRAYPIVQHNFARDDYGEFARIDRIVSDARLMDRASCVSCMGWDIETSVLCVAAGFGYALVPGYYTQRILASEQVVAVPVEGLEQEIVVVAAWMPHTQNELIDVFLDEFLSVG
jgi:DNA-binding transcriptional LysR family regulator